MTLLEDDALIPLYLAHTDGSTWMDLRGWIYMDAMDGSFVQGLPSGSFLTAPVVLVCLTVQCV